MCKLRLIVTLSVSLFFSFSNSLIAQSVTGEVSLVDRLGATVLSYETGDSVYVLVADADRNVSSSASDTLTVRLRSDKETTEEALVLIETGVNTGIFSGYMLFDETGSVSADGKLQVDRGDKLVARYRDPSDDFGNVTNETATSFYGLTVVNGGSLLGNTTWSTSGSPYLLTGDITVPNTVTLTIESGVEVRFTPLTDDLSSGEDVNRIELIIEGVLRVKGAQSDTVTFMSNGQVPASGDWYGIVSKGSTGKVLIDYASINHYTNGIRIKDGSWTNTYNNSDTVGVSNTKFYGGGSAISADWTGSYRPVIFNDNRLVECGVSDYSYSAYKEYTNNTFEAGVSYKTLATRIEAGSNSDAELIINNNTFSKGYIYLDGVYLYGEASISIKSNTLGRESYGIQVYCYNYASSKSDGSVEISNNTILGDKSSISSGVGGIYLYTSGDYGLNIKAENNTIRSIRRGIYISSNKSSHALIKSNTIDSTYYQGIYLDRVSGRIESNTLTKCGAYSYFGVDINSDFNYPSVDTIRYNTITGNGYWYSPSNTSTTGGWGGIRLNGYTQAKINYNNIYDNGAYEVVNMVAASSVSEQDAKFNYWGTYNNSQIALGANPKNLFKIYDEYDNSSLGFVNYGGYLNAAYPNGVPSSQSVTGEVSLVDRLGATVLSYETGDSVYVLVADADRNVSSSASDTLTVRLRSDKETTEEALVLIETGVNTGIFSGYMLFDETGSVSADGKLQVDRGDKLVARYRDPSDDFGNVTNETATSFYGLTVVNGGSLLGNTTWSTSGSPYLLTGDITVPNTVTLTIESGVEVRFTPLTDDLSSGEDVNRIELIIEGVLRVKGAQSDTVTFMSNGQVPASGDWYGIVSKGSTGKVLIDYASINHYTNGIRIKDGSWTNTYNNSDTVGVSNTKFYGGGSAISADWTGSYRPVIFNDNRLVECGVSDYSYSAYKEYTNNTFEAGVSYKTLATRIEAGSNSDAELIINNNTFSKGYIYLDGVYLYGEASISIKSNTLGRESYGIQVYCYNYASSKSDGSVEISNNTILGDKSSISSGVGGIYLYTSGDYGLNIKAENNTIRSIRRGIYISSNKSSHALIKSNTIDSTYYQGIYLDRVSGRIESNTLTKCGAYSYFGVDINSDFNYPSVDTIRYNTITGNGYWYSPSNTSTTGGWGGIRLNGYTQAKINYNNIYDNGAYEVVNMVAASSVSEQDAKFNYWGTYNNSQIALGANPKNLFKIYDKYDNSSLGFVNYGQNQSNILFDELPDTVYYGGDSVRIASSSNKYGDWSTGETNTNHVDLTGYEGELIFTYTLGSDVLKDTVQVINLDAIYVSNSGSNQNDGRSSNRFKTIQKAIEEADAGDTIYIASGNYSYFRILEDQLYVYGEDSLNRPVITGHDTTRVIESTVVGVEIKHLSLRNGNAPVSQNWNRGALMYAEGPALIASCDFKDGYASQGGDYYAGAGRVTFVNCEFLKNTKNTGGEVFMVDNGMWMKIYNSFIDAEGFGRVFQNGYSHFVYNTTIINLEGGLGIQSWSGHEQRYVNNIVVEKPGANVTIFPSDTTGFWNGWNGDNIYLNNRFPRSISSMTHWNGAQLISTNNDTLPVLFRDSANGDYRLSIYDRHLDKGTDTIALYADAFGVTRVDSGGFVDYGAYETNGRGIIDVYACPGDDIGIDPFGITAPVWNNGDQGSTDVGLGKYWASGTINGNAYVDTFMVIDAGIDIQSSDTIVCPGTEVTLTAVGWQGKVDPIFTWGDGTVNVSTSATVSENTTFYLYSDFDGISCTDSFTVYVNRPAISSSSDFACAADSTLLIVESQKYLNNQISATSTLNDSMLLWMPFDGTIKDEGPGSNSFTNTGVVLANGRNGSSGNIARLDGDSYLEFDSPIATGQKQMTFAFWAQTNSNSAQDIIGQNCGTDCGTDVRVQLNPAQCSGDGLGFKSPAHFAAAPQTHDSSWHHYALVMGSGDNFSYSNFKFYIDGVEVSNSCGHNWGGWTYTMPNEPLRIGKGASLGTNFNGLLDDIGVWKRALTSSEVQELASMGEDLEAVTQVLWSTGETNDSIWVKQSGTSQYWVQTQFGDAVCSDSVKVFTAEIASSDTIVCPGTAVTLNAIGINGLRDVPASYIKLGQLGDKQYFLDTTVQSWTDANASALSNGFSLVDIQDSTENAAVGSMVSGSGLVQNSGVWIGVYQDVNASNYSEPSGGWTHVNSNSNYYPWALGEPNNAFSNPGENYAELYIFNGQPVWADLQNSFTRFAVVEVPTYMYEPIYWSTGDTGISTVVTPLQTSTYYIYSENAGLTCTNELTIYVNDPDISASTSYACDGDSVLLSVGSQSFYAPAIPGSSTLNDSMLLWMPFKGNIEDEGPNGNVFNNTGVVLGAHGNGSNNNVAEFDGSSFLELDSALITGQTPMTFAFWAKSSSTSKQNIIGQTCGQSGDCFTDVMLQLNTSGCNNSGFGFKSRAHFASTPNLNDTIWHHYAIVMGKEDNYSYSNFRFYVDGAEVQNNCGHNWGGWTYTMPNDALTIGKGGTQGGGHFNGKLDDLGAWNRALSPSEITELASMGGSLEASSSILWSTGQTTDSIWINQTQTSSYWVQTTLGDAVCWDTITINSAELTVTDQFICEGESITASIAGWDSTASSFVYWSSMDTSTSMTTILDTTTQFKVYTTVNGESCIDSINVYVNDPGIDVSTRFLCESGTLSFAVEDETTYGLDSLQSKTFVWSTGDTVSAFNLIQDSTTQYVVTSTWSSSVCYDSVIVNNKHFTNPSDAICYGGPQTISVDGWADGEAVMVNWSTGDTSTSIVVSPLVDTTYYVTTSYAGVSCTDTAHIYVNDARITASSMVVCVGDSVSLSVPELSTSGQTKSILWSTGDTTSTIWVSQDSTTSYWVSVGLSDAGCTDTIEILTTIPVPQISSSFTTYNLGTGLELTSTSATTYTWSDSTTGSSINVYPSITTDYWVKVTDTNACVGYDTITVEAAQITFRVNMRTQIVDSTKGVHLAGNFQGWDPDSTQMYDADGDGIYEVTLGLVSGDAGIEFKYINGNSWSDGHDDNLDSCTNVTTSGDRSYTVAFANDTLPVYHLSSCDENMPIDPLVDAQSFECVGDTTFLDAGPGLTDIIWNTGDTSRVLAATTPGWYWFLAKYPHQVRVYDSTYVNFYEYTDTSVAISGPTSFCDEDSVVLGLASDLTAFWNSGSTLNNLVVTQSGSYYATLLDTNGCSKNTDTIAVTVWQLPSDTIFTFGGTEICDGDSATISATYGYDYAWNNGDTNYYTVIKQAGDYAVTITDGNGCVSESDTISIVVNILPNDSLTLSGLPEFCDRDSLTISAQSGYNYQWSDGSLGQALTVYQSGQVHVQLTDNKGCISESDTIDVIVNPLPDTSITVIGSLDLCPGDTVTLSAASGMGDYFWSTGSNFQAIDITQSGLYRVTLVSSDGCVDTSAYFQSVMHPLPVVSSIIGSTTGVTPMQNYVYLVSQNSGSTYTWSITNGVIVSGQGTNVVTVMWSQASNGMLSVIESNGYCEDSTEVAISTTFSVSETAINPAILFPNPTKGMFKIVMNYAEPVKVHLVDSRGKELSTFSKNSKEIELDASEYPAGVYQVILEFENEVQVLRLVVIH
ncbi:T9SS type A sorting domain-containing protein [Schleiferiaceae bacterium]|nr:T9SS type A sorting domain-containing protein [Schleiferiaceae bacterium]